MKCRLLPLVGLALAVCLAGRCHAAGAATEGPSLFGLTNLWTIHLTIDAADWKTLGSKGGPQRNFGGGAPGSGLLDALTRWWFGGEEAASSQQSGGPQGKGAGDSGSRYPWAQCTFEAAGQKLTNVGVRLKGVSSLARAPNGYKRPFKLDFDRGSKDRRFLGVEELYLNNNVNDATQMREALAYELFRRAGLPAPRTAFASLYLTIPGRVERQHLGLYTLVEVAEGDFLKRHFGSKKGLLLKPEMMQGLQYMGGDWSDYRERYHPEGEADANQTKRFIEFVRFIREAKPEQFAAGLTNYLDPGPFARFVALNAILANVDSFIGNGHNYFLHVHPASHQATFIPWDLNEAFGMHPVSGASREQMQFSILRPNGDPNQLVERLVGDPALGRMYRAQCAALLANVFVPAKLAADIDRIAAVTKPVVFAESKRARADFERTILGTLKPDEGDLSQPRHDAEIGRAGYRPWGFPDEVEIDNLPLKEWITGRAAHARDQLEGRVRGKRPRPRL